LHALPNIIRVIKLRMTRWARHVARMELMRNEYKTLLGKFEGKRTLGRPRSRGEVIRMDIREGGGDWMHLA